MECSICKEFYTVIVCSKCGGYCGIKNFMSGFAYECSCQNKAIYIVCNGCNNILSLPANKNYEKVKLKCKGCSNDFRYKICGTCRSCIYKKGDEEG